MRSGSERVHRSPRMPWWTPPDQGLARPMPASVLVFSLLLACGGADEADRPGGPPPALVRTGTVAAGDLIEHWRAVGEVRPLQAAELAAGATGPVSAVHAREGETIAKGARLLEVDAGPAAARARAARAAADEAMVELDRLQAALARREAVAQGVLAMEELQDARAAVARQTARVAALEAGAGEASAELARHTVRAPFAGALTERRVDPGDWVTAGQPVLDLVSIDSLEVHARIPGRVARRLAPGDPVRLPEQGGTVTAIVPALDPASRTVLVRIEPGAGALLAAGDAIDIQLPVSWTGMGVKVPRDALLLEPDQARVLKIVDGAAMSVEIEVLATADDDALVSGEGLAIGDVVITRGNERVRSGQVVRVEDVE